MSFNAPKPARRLLATALAGCATDGPAISGRRIVTSTR